ncbi:MAG: sugar phosphate nucleotidyltransferase [Promethearchaeia archaeon]
MEIQLSQHGNNPFKETIFLLLCAGKGTRLRTITKKIPKPLIPLDQANNKPILQYTLKHLLELHPKQIIVITGYLSEKIDDFITKFKKSHRSAENILSSIRASKKYELGPIYSFISISKSKMYFSKDYNYCVLPGDTVFDFSTFHHIQDALGEHLQEEIDIPLVFYRNVPYEHFTEVLRDKRQNAREIISILDYEEAGNVKRLKKIKKKVIPKINQEQDIKQIIPLFYLTYNFILEIKRAMPQHAVSRLTEIINILITDYAEKIKVMEVPADVQFYDIDTKQDLEQIKLFDK